MKNKSKKKKCGCRGGKGGCSSNVFEYEQNLPYKESKDMIEYQRAIIFNYIKK